jgi:hypothetical protein
VAIEAFDVVLEHLTTEWSLQRLESCRRWRLSAASKQSKDYWTAKDKLEILVPHELRIDDRHGSRGGRSSPIL